MKAINIISIILIFTGYAYEINADTFSPTVITAKDSTSVYATDQNAFYVSNPDLAGQCTWYVYGRVIELTDKNELDDSVGIHFYNAFWGKSGRHAKNWPDFLGGSWFCTHNDVLPIEQRKKGLVAVWKFGDYGHVGFVEEISADNRRYRLTDFNRSNRTSYKDEWYKFDKNDSLGKNDIIGGVYPCFYDPEPATSTSQPNNNPPIYRSGSATPLTINSGDSITFRTSWHDPEDDFIVGVRVRYCQQNSDTCYTEFLDWLDDGAQFPNDINFEKSLEVTGEPGIYDYRFFAVDANPIDTPLHQDGELGWYDAGTFTIMGTAPPPVGSTTDCAQVTEIPQAECEALVALYNSTDGPNWLDSPENNWNVTNTPCSDWRGVWCNYEHVVGIQLNNNNLHGIIPNLSALTHLAELDLSENQLFGSIPILKTLTNLRNINLTFNFLSGQLPDLSTLTHLEYLDLADNQLGGYLPDFSTLVNLQGLGLSGNYFRGNIPSSLATLPSLQHLGLFGNCLTTSDPTLIAFLNDKDPDWRYPQYKNCFSGNYTISGTVSLPIGHVAPVGGINIDAGFYGLCYENSCERGSYAQLKIPENQSSTSFAMLIPDDSNTEWNLSIHCNDEVWDDNSNTSIFSGNCNQYVPELWYSTAGMTQVFPAPDTFFPGGQNYPNVNITLLPGVPISGSISLPPGTVAPSDGLEVTIEAAQITPVPFNEFTGETVIIPEGESTTSYTITVIDDPLVEWIVSYWCFSDVCTEEYLESGYYTPTGMVADIEDDGFLPGGQGYSGIDLTLIPIDTQTPAEDTQPPSITVSQPSNFPFSTEDTHIRIAGTATDNVGVVRVTWAINGGDSNEAVIMTLDDGSTGWHVDDVALQDGENVITVTAYDAAGLHESMVLEVNRISDTQNVASNLRLTPEVVNCGVFDPQDAWTIEETCSVSLTNKSDKTITVKQVFLTGKNANDYQIVFIGGYSAQATDFILPPYYTTPIILKFNPQELPDNNENYDVKLIAEEKTTLGDVIATTATIKSGLFSLKMFDASPRIFRIDENGNTFTASLSATNTFPFFKLKESEVTDEKALVNIDNQYIREGFVADGNARLLLQASTFAIEGDVIFRISEGTAPLLYPLNNSGNNDAQGQQELTVPITIVDSNNNQGQATVILRAPEQFPGNDDVAEVSFTVEACLADTVPDICVFQTIRIRRAPVILIHGIWGSADSFRAKRYLPDDDMIERLTNAHFPVRPYEYQNAEGPTQVMTTYEPSLKDNIEMVCNEQIEDHLACTKVDIVAHSMGGLVTRKYALDNAFFLNNRNFYQNNIRRIITMGTPHIGSPLANLLWWLKGTQHDRDIVNNCLEEDNDQRQSDEIIEERKEELARNSREMDGDGYIIRPTDQGGVEDLRVDSDLIRLLNDTISPNKRKLKIRALIGDIGIAFQGALSAFVDIQEDIGCTPAEVFSNSHSDGIVTVESAGGQGRFPSETITDASHLGMGTNANMINPVIERLNGELSLFESKPIVNPTGSNLWVDNNTVSLRKKLLELEFQNKSSLSNENDTVADELPSIVLNVDKLVFTPGETILFNTNIKDNKVTRAILVNKRGDIFSPTSSSPLQWSISDLGTGVYSFAVIARLNKQNITSNEVTVTVRPDLNELIELKFSPANPVVLYPGYSLKLYVLGKFPNGSHYLNGSAMGTSYNEQIVQGVTTTAGDSPAIHVDPEGVVQALQPGVADVIATNNEKNTITRIHVLQATPAIDIDGDGILDTEADSDGDSIPDSAEETLGTDKYNPDSDGDSTADNIEIGDDLLSPRDSDGDGKIDALDDSIRSGIPILANYTVFGKIINKLDGPISNVTVQIGDNTVTTNDEGYWEIKGLKKGNYKLTASKDGYIFTPEDITIEGEDLTVEIDMNIVELASASCQLYAVHDQKRSDSQLFTVDTENYQINKLGPLYEGYDIEAIAVHPETNLIYAVSGKDVTKDKPRGQLYAVDGQTGELFPIGNTHFKEIEDLAFGKDGTLWAWAKGDGMITIDTTTGAGTLIIPSEIKVEGLTINKNAEHTVFYGSVSNELWIYDQTSNHLEVACTNLPGETEALELLPDDILLMGIHKDKSFSLQAFNAKTCQIATEINIPTNPFDDVEGIALPVAACAQ